MARFSEKDTKTLWGRAAGICSMPECRAKLTQDAKAVPAAANLGEMAHIVAEEEGGPRGQSILTVNERNSYPNLILLCPTCHTRIDKADLVADFPIEKLHYIKSLHEQWIEDTLAVARDRAQEAADLVYASLVDSALSNCMLEKWGGWISGFFSVFPNCHMSVFQNLQAYWEDIEAAIWPNRSPELEGALKSLQQTTSSLIHVFGKHATADDRRPNVIIIEPNFRSYKHAEERKVWQSLLDMLVADATASANWLGDVVRRDLNPMFLVTNGKFRFFNEAVAPHGGPAIFTPELSVEERKKLMNSSFPSVVSARVFERDSI